MGENKGVYGNDITVVVRVAAVKLTQTIFMLAGRDVIAPSQRGGKSERHTKVSMGFENAIARLVEIEIVCTN
jgi:hypothetical protein